MISLLSFLNGPWEKVRVYLQEDLDSLTSAVNKLIATAITTTTPIPTGTIPLSGLAPSSAPARLIGRGSSGAGVWEELSLGSGLSINGTVLSAANPAFQLMEDGNEPSLFPAPGDNFQTTLNGLYIPYVGAIKNVDLGLHNLTVDTTTLFVDSATHRVGIGTITPSQTLEVAGNATIDGQWTAAAAIGNLGVLNNSAADAGVIGGCYLTFQTATTTRWFLGMSAAGGTGNFDLYDNIDGYNVAAWTKGSGLFQCLKGITVTGLTTVGTVTAGAITCINPLIVHTNGAAQRIDIGATGDTSSSSQIRFFQDSTHFNWQVGAGIQNNDTLSFTPSTAVNGTTFTTPLVTMAAGGLGINTQLTVIVAAGLLASFDNSSADAGVTNASYFTFKTAGTVRYYVGISTSGGTGDFEIYNNGAGNLAFSVNKTTSAIKLFNKITSYNNIATTGWGVPAIYGTGRSTAQTAAVASVATYTVGAADGSFIVSANVNVTTSTLHSFTAECAYTDETNTARVLTLSFSQLTGAFVTAITNATGAGPYEGVSLQIRCKASTAITIRTQAAGTYTTVTYNVEGSITQIS